MRHVSAKRRKKGGRRGLRPWPLRCLSQILSERRENATMANVLRMFVCTFHRWGDLVFIADDHDNFLN